MIEKNKFNPKRLYAKRMEKGLSLDQLAKLVGRRTSTVHYWETGHSTPTATSLYILATALGVTANYFFRR